MLFDFYLQNGLGLSYNDARSHLDIGRRVVEGLKPGLAQLGSVWLPLPHLLMIPTIWSDFMWHSGLSGALQSMISFVVTGGLIYYYLKRLNVGALGRVVGVGVFLANINVLYMQSTAMTELLLLATMTAACFELLNFFKSEKLLSLIKASFWVMLSTLIRYDGWFLLVVSAGIVSLYTYKKIGFKGAEARLLFFSNSGSLRCGALVFVESYYLWRSSLLYLWSIHLSICTATSIGSSREFGYKKRHNLFYTSLSICARIQLKCACFGSWCNRSNCLLL